LPNSYVATDLGTPIKSGYKYTLDLDYNPPALNNKGQVVSTWLQTPGVVGSGETSSAVGFLYTPSVGYKDMGSLAIGDEVFPAAINDSGEAVGSTGLNSGGGPSGAGFTYINGTMKSIGTLTGRQPLDNGAFSIASAINASGLIAGQSQNSANNDVAIQYSNGTMTALGKLANYPNSEAVGINASGQIVGYGYSSTANHAFLYSGGSMKDLGTLPGSNMSVATAINDFGQIIGTSSQVSTDGSQGSGNGGPFGFVYANGTMQSLNTLSGVATRSNIPYGINNDGVIVGFAELPSVLSGATVYTGAAFIYYKGAIHDLESLTSGLNDVKLYTAYAVNNNGSILAVGADSNFVVHLMLLTPSNATKAIRIH